MKDDEGRKAPAVSYAETAGVAAFRWKDCALGDRSRLGRSRVPIPTLPGLFFRPLPESCAYYSKVCVTSPSVPNRAAYVEPFSMGRMGVSVPVITT